MPATQPATHVAIAIADFRHVQTLLARVPAEHADLLRQLLAQHTLLTFGPVAPESAAPTAPAPEQNAVPAAAPEIEQV